IISAVPTGLLKTSTGGVVSAAVAGVDYATAASTFGKSWEVNGSGATAYLAPTSTTGIIVNASSTIGGATNGSGLTILGGATTTLLHLFQSGFLSSASSTINGTLVVTGNATATNATTTAFFSTTASST